MLAAGMPDRYESQLFVPMALRPDQMTHTRHWTTVMGRLKPGGTLRQANTDMNGVARRIAETYPASNKGWGVSVRPLKNNFTSRDTIKDLWLLMGAAGDSSGCYGGSEIPVRHLKPEMAVPLRAWAMGETFLQLWT